MLKIALIGNEIPFYFPNILADAVYAHHIPCQLSFYQENNEVSELLLSYGNRITKGSSVTINRAASVVHAVENADGIIYASDNKSTSYYHQDIEYLSQVDPSCRFLGNHSPYSGIAGLMQILRQSSAALPIGKIMKEQNPQAKIVVLSPNTTAIIQLLAQMGLNAIGFDREALGFYQDMARQTADVLGEDEEDIHFGYAGLEHFNWLVSMSVREKQVPLSILKNRMLQENQQEELLTHWMDVYDAIAFGNGQEIGQFMPAQPLVKPMDQVVFTETVEERKERILSMNQISKNGLETEEGQKAQDTLLSTVSNVRPLQAVYKWLNIIETPVKGVLQVNKLRQIKNLPEYAVITDDLLLEKGEGKLLPPAVLDLAFTISYWQKCLAEAAYGNWSKLREAVEEDLALEGCDRLAAFTTVQEFIEQYRQILPQFFIE